ncbi:MAG: 4'-phosphopantetheinyl transferase superfamily protein [Anaerolineae bacterium]
MIHWLLQTAMQHPDLARGVWPQEMLGAAEQQRVALFRTEKRQREWLLGRWTAKQLVQQYLEQETGQRAPLDALVIAREPGGAPVVVFDAEAVPMDLPTGARWISGASLLGNAELKPDQPVPVVSGMRLPVSLSISHSDDTALCALYAAADGSERAATHALLNGFPASGEVQVGVDIEQIEARSAGFAQAYFTAKELGRLAETPQEEQALLATAIWSAKEAVLKALHLGLVVDTRRISCLPATSSAAAGGWMLMLLQMDADLLPEAQRRTSQSVVARPWSLRGWWRYHGRFVLTLAALHVEVDT